MKFARSVQFQIKSGKEQEFSKLFEGDVLPMLRKQTGFKEELTLVDGTNAVGISFWDDRANANTYAEKTYPRVLETLGPVLEGTPRVETYRIGLNTMRPAIA